jgi:hypothetical protein
MNLMQKPTNDLCGGKRKNTIHALRSQHATRKFYEFDQACHADDRTRTTHAKPTLSRMPRVTGTLTGAKPV